MDEEVLEKEEQEEGSLLRDAHAMLMRCERALALYRLL